MIDISTLTPQELFELKDRLASILVFGPWEQSDEWSYTRPSPCGAPNRIHVWLTGHEDSDLEAGWYYRIDCGVLCIPGITGTKPFSEPGDCMEAVDQMLQQAEDVYLVDEDVPP